MNPRRDPLLQMDFDARSRALQTTLTDNRGTNSRHTRVVDGHGGVLHTKHNNFLDTFIETDAGPLGTLLRAKLREVRDDTRLLEDSPGGWLSWTWLTSGNKGLGRLAAATGRTSRFPVPEPWLPGEQMNSKVRSSISCKRKVVEGISLVRSSKVTSVPVRRVSVSQRDFSSLLEQHMRRASAAVQGPFLSIPGRATIALLVGDWAMGLMDKC